MRGHSDGRTVHRSLLFIEAAARIATDAAIPLIDSTSPIRAFPLLSTDPAHYTDSAIRKHLPDVILGQLGAGLCPNRLHAQQTAETGAGAPGKMSRHKHPDSCAGA